MLLHTALMGQWRYSLVTEKVTATIQIAKQIYSLAQGQNDSAPIIEACGALATPLYFLGDFERENTRGEVFRFGARKDYSLRSAKRCLLQKPQNEA
jgi:hypothetical protein